MAEHGKLNTAVLGAGLIGIDLIERIQRSPLLHCGLVVGRDSHTRGLEKAASMGCSTASGGIGALNESGQSFDIVFDASNAASHAEHWAKLQSTDATLIDLTPSRIGTMVVPTINGTSTLSHRHINLVSCGGQASVPILNALSQHYRPAYIEVVTTGASHSAGRATRLNLDEYIDTTQEAVRTFTNCEDVKVMTNLSPAKPAPPFRVSMTLLVANAEADKVRSLVDAAAEEVRRFSPGFSVVSCRTDEGRISIAVTVTATGSRIPRYAGNLGIINAAAVLLAEKRAQSRFAA
ncbi:acetylating acetaldehyde dehydrogenase [Streptomyces sp. VB1]|uniref:acetylating acetaldehyde dehydrogenase n=1 Tax=Streptomyces sp. VB1 TaxID=2986803 RepID=UPI00224236EB|nr:acetaldehyde dehydrogenase (acetylating) [Streptomyces sp. VB1]UZI32373.1 acetaldehyde dehydrogenase (acetylating) [Streptomyces sp. VB1]